MDYFLSARAIRLEYYSLYDFYIIVIFSLFSALEIFSSLLNLLNFLKLRKGKGARASLRGFPPQSSIMMATCPFGLHIGNTD